MLKKLESTDGFVVTDLDGADHAMGVVRLAPKILVDGATMLARSLTYQFALFERRVSGASAGINAKPEGRDEAIHAFVGEVAPLVEQGALGIDAGKGVDRADLAHLHAIDTRNPLSHRADSTLIAVSVAAAASSALGGLDGRTVAIEGFDLAGDSGVAVARQLVLGGARVVAVSTAAGTATAGDGSFDPDALAAALGEHGAGMVAQLGVEPGKAWEATAADADLLLPGSKAGVITHDNAGYVKAKAVVPIGRVPVTAKALAMLRRAGTVVVPDFVSLAGPGFAAWPDGEPSTEEVIHTITDSVRAVMGEALAHEDGPLLACCYQAETFLRTWQEKLPFGRPLA